MKDTEFIRGEVPMTKEEIRTIVLSKLELKSEDTLLDIGAGTGSIAIEAALSLTKGKVIAIEQKNEAIDLIYQNIQKHGLSNLEVKHAKAPEGFNNLDSINKYFIGGSGGNLEEILLLISNKAPEESIIVVTAIVLDTMYKAYQFFKENNYIFEIVQVSVNKVDADKKVAMLIAQNPIFILTARKKQNMITNTNQGKLYGIGIGPGDPELLTIKAVKAVERADIIYVPKSKEQASTALHIVEEYLPKNAVIEHLEFPMARELQTRIDSRKRNAEIIAAELNEGKMLVFLTLGDPMLYSTYSYVLEHLNPTYNIETIPGIYSFAAISSLLSLPLCKGDEKLTVISSFDAATPNLIQASDTIVFMKVSAYYKQLFDFLSENSEYNFVMITDAGKKEQKTYNSIDILREKVPYFSTVIIQKENVLETKNLEICQA